jgi:hypothetical protein
MLRRLSSNGGSTGASVFLLSDRRHSRVTARPFPAGAREPDDTAKTTPTLFLDFDGTLHIGRAAMAEDGSISLNTGRPLFEFAPLLIEQLKPYPAVRVVLTTSWLMTLLPEDVIALMPSELARRVVGTTRCVKPRLSDVLNGTNRTYVISRYAQGMQLKHWLAVDDAVFGADQYGYTREELVEHFLLLHPALGLSDDRALRRIADWLGKVST